MAAVPYDSPSGIGLGQRDPWTVKHIRPFDRWPDSASEQERIWDSRIIRVPSFNYEFGSRVVRELTDDPKLEDEDKFVEYFKTYLYGKAYKTYFCDLGDQEPVVVIIQGKEQPVLGPAVAKKMQSRKVMIISKKDDERLLIPLVAGKVRIKDMLRQLRPDLQTAEFRQIVDDTIDTDLLDFMTKQIITNYKFGVLYQRAGQTEEDQWYNNVDGSSELEEFLTFLGDRITLNGWNKFRGGLSVTDEKTGTHSIYTTFRDLEIMFHVSTYIPYYPNDPQQVERKRHLGNDVVVIVFRESDCKEPFDPLKIKSQFNHTFCVVQPLATKESGITQYKICFVSRDTGLPYGPLLPSLPTFARTEKLRKWLLTKLVNAERAAMYSPEFKERLWKARKMILHDLVSRHASASHSTRVGAAAATSVDAVGGGLKKIITAPVTVARAVPLPLHMHEASKAGLSTSMRSPGRSTTNPSFNVVPPIAADEVVSTIEPTTLLSGSFGSPKKSMSSEAPPPMSARDRDREARDREKEKEKERVEKEKAERERERVERKERERLEKEKEKADKEREKAERAEKEAAERERKERERKEKEAVEAAERERRDRERKEREAAAKEAAALQKSSPAKSVPVPLSMAPEDRPMFMEDEAGFSPPMTKAKERAAAEKAAAAKKKPR